MEDKQTKDLLEHLNKLLKEAIKGQPSDKLAKCWRYYKGDFEQGDRVINQRNVIQPIIETKTTLTLDAQIVTSVIPQLHSMQDIKSYNQVEKMASILNDCTRNVFKINEEDTLRQKIIRNGNIFGFAPVEVVWDDEFRFSGDIKINFIHPKCFYPDPTAKKVEDCNYIFIEESMSPITLKAKYPDYAKRINKLVGIENDDAQDYGDKQPTGMGSVQTNSNAQLIYKYKDNSYISKNNKNIKVWKCYLKDDTTFEAEINAKDNTNDDNDETIKKEARKYPYGRIILFIDGVKDFVLEDKEIDYPFGYPIDVYNPVEAENLFGISETENLFEVQDRVNRAYSDIQRKIHESNKWIINKAGSGIKPDAFKTKKSVINNVLQTPEILDNFQLEDLAEKLQWIDMLKNDALQIARLNQQMLSGERQPGVNSGVGMKTLNESPMSAIRAAQRNYKEFIVSLTNKIIALIQKYYNTPRMLTLSNGTQFAQIYNTENGVNLSIYGKPDDIEAQQQAMGMQQENQLLETIQGGFEVGRYDVDVIAGTEVPRSPQERSALSLQLLQLGQYPKGIEGTKLLYNDLDVPNRKMLIEMLEKQQEIEAQTLPPPPIELAKELDSMPSWAVIKILSAYGITPPEGMGIGIPNPDLPLKEQNDFIDKDIQGDRLELDHAKAQTEAMQKEREHDLKEGQESNKIAGEMLDRMTPKPPIEHHSNRYDNQGTPNK